MCFDPPAYVIIAIEDETMICLIRRLILPVLLLCALSACSADTIDSETLESATRIIYEFQDSSVPPPYHRSYIIIIEAAAASITVDSYGEILAEEQINLGKGVFPAVLALIEEAEIGRRRNAAEDEGCTGGTGEGLTLERNGEELFSAWVYHCGGDDYGTLTGGIENVAVKIRGLFDNFSELIE